jgi:hypothetical protein
MDPGRTDFGTGGSTKIVVKMGARRSLGFVPQHSPRDHAVLGVFVLVRQITALDIEIFIFETGRRTLSFRPYLRVFPHFCPMTSAKGFWNSSRGNDITLPI